MILNIYSKLTKEQEINDALKMAEYMVADTPGYKASKASESEDPDGDFEQRGAWTVFRKKSLRSGSRKPLYSKENRAFGSRIFLNRFWTVFEPFLNRFAQ